MKIVRIALFSIGLVALVFALVPGRGSYQAVAAPELQTSTSQIDPGNYCISCHAPDDSRLATAPRWFGSIESEVTSPCPAVTRIHEEIYYTERMLLAIDRAQGSLSPRADLGKTANQIAAAQQTYSRLLDTPVTSLSAFESEAQMLRFKLGKIYTQLNSLEEGVKRQNILIAAILVTVFLLASLAWGIRNTQGFSKAAHKLTGLRFNPVFWAGLVFVLFALPIFAPAPTTVTETTPEQQARQTILDTAQRNADAAEQAYAGAWMLSRLAAVWSPLNPEKAELVLSTSLASTKIAQLNSAVLWGEAQAVREVSAGSTVETEKASLIADSLKARRSRAWSLSLIAAEASGTDGLDIEAILKEAWSEANSSSGLYRDFDLRGIAAAWAEINFEQSLRVASSISDPAVRSWTLLDLARITGNSSLYRTATLAAGKISEPVLRSQVLAAVGAASSNPQLFDDAQAALEGLTGSELAYALAELAVTSGDEAIIESIDPAYPAAQAEALYHLGRFEEAWHYATQISDPYGRSHAQMEIAIAWSNSSAAQEIPITVLRDRAIREIALASGDQSLLQQVQSPYYRVQILTALGETEQALEEAEGLLDFYPLQQLAVALAGKDPQAALALADKMDRETDKAIALRAVSAATQDDDVFERALGMAMAARVRNDALAPMQSSLDLALAFLNTDVAKAEAALLQAYEIAERIAVR